MALIFNLFITVTGLMAILILWSLYQLLHLLCFSGYACYVGGSNLSRYIAARRTECYRQGLLAGSIQYDGTYPAYYYRSIQPRRSILSYRSPLPRIRWSIAVLFFMELDFGTDTWVNSYTRVRYGKVEHVRGYYRRR